MRPFWWHLSKKSMKNFCDDQNFLAAGAYTHNAAGAPLLLMSPGTVDRQIHTALAMRASEASELHFACVQGFFRREQGVELWCTAI